jgi:2,3-bisphosphoglycerate-independent phosphoglycerate mutase
MYELDGKGHPKVDGEGRPKPRTSHSLNPVPFLVYRPSGSSLALRDDLPDAGLGNVAATLLELLGYSPPEDYLPSIVS